MDDKPEILIQQAVGQAGKRCIYAPPCMDRLWLADVRLDGTVWCDIDGNRHRVSHPLIKPRAPLVYLSRPGKLA